ncbi:MAG: 16S rRNA (cytosine(1402)-N(4))-methyltransferase RsmH [Chthoniobacteraceae bacterium]
MSDPAPEKPKRRPRYSGKNPRHFSEKYKEHAPERYASDVAKVLASGKTPAGMHRPVMLREILELLAPKPGDVVVDCTLGYGGHAREILAAIQPGGRLIGLDVDPIELPKTEARLRDLGYGPDTFNTHRTNFAGLAKILPEPADAILADLGLSSMQIDNPARGFTFKHDGPLDLRMNPERGQPASALLAGLDVKRLITLLIENADEPNAISLAGAIVRSSISTTLELVQVITSAGGDDAAVRRIFQALRIAVNDEFSALDNFLRQLPLCIKPGGRVAILSFHSGEDRRVKKAFQGGLRDGSYSAVSPDVLRPTAPEIRANPRASSAKLRWAQR